MKSRKSIRWKGYDYSRYGAYFVTICTRNRENLLCEIKNNLAILSKFGEIVQEEWGNLTGRSSDLELDEFTVMPNHIHGIVNIVGAGLAPARTVGTTVDDPLMTAKTTSSVILPSRAGASPAPTVRLGEIIGSFKSLSDLRCRKAFASTNPDLRFGRLWQRNFYDRVLRDEAELMEIREYMRSNILTWHLTITFRKT